MNQRKKTGIALAVIAAVFLSVWQRTPRADHEHVIAASDLAFTDARRQAEQFIEYYHSIALTPEQETIKTEALERIPAPCCESFSIATCCCPCNLAKSAWGLAHFLIARRGYDVAHTRDAVERWLRFTNESGYRGDACQRGRCSLPFRLDGCGGMNEAHVS